MLSGSNVALLPKLFFVVHILCAIVGFGSTFVWAILAKQAKDFGPEHGLLFTQKIVAASKVLTTPFIWATGATGVILVVLGKDYGFSFSQTWVSAAFVLFLAGVGVAEGLQRPNQKAMVALQERLVSGQVTPPSGGGPPAEVAELEERGGKAAMFGGMLHLLFLLLVLDMIFKPGFGA